MSIPDLEKDGTFPVKSTTEDSANRKAELDSPEKTTADTNWTPRSPSLRSIPEPQETEPFPSLPPDTAAVDGVVPSIPTPTVVLRSKRRGLFGRFALLAEIENAQTYPRKAKWFITFIVAVAGATAPMASSIFFPALNHVATDLGASHTITNLSISLYMLSMAIFPLWWSSFSERSGRRTIYLTSFSLFVVFNSLCAKSNSIAMLIVFRMLSGGASASVQAVGAGTIADVWEPYERGRAMGIFYLGPLCGPLLAPIIGGALAQRWGWRSTLWFLALYGGLTLIFIFLALPETLPARKHDLSDVNDVLNTPIERRSSRVSSRQVVQFTTRWLKLLRMIFIDPLKIILNLRYPAVLLTVYYASITFGSLYILNVSIQQTFSRPPYNFSTLYIGLLYIPNSVGYVVASVFGGRWMDKIMTREARKANRVDANGNLIYRPEDRMRENAWLGAFLYPAALLWYGWSVNYGVFWLVPMAGNFFFGIGSMFIFSIATTMLTEFMPKKSSNGVAVNNFLRNIFSSVGAVIAAPAIGAIGNGWLFTILSIIGFASGSVILAMKYFGPRWRQKMEA